MAQLLERWGHETRVVHDGPGALEMVSGDAFDVILLDIGLPGMDGYQGYAAANQRETRASMNSTWSP